MTAGEINNFHFISDSRLEYGGGSPADGSSSLTLLHVTEVQVLI